MFGELSRKYESSGDCGNISTGWGDAGGKSYGLFQFASKCGVVEDFIAWLNECGHPFGKLLSQYDIGSDDFDEAWRTLADTENDEFTRMQEDYTKGVYYDTSCALLYQHYYDMAKHSETMKDVLFSRSIQYGSGNIVEMFETACCDILGYPNLSYVDDISMDDEMIDAIYLKVCMTPEWTNGSPDLREGLYNRFINECADAQEMLAREVG